LAYARLSAFFAPPGLCPGGGLRPGKVKNRLCHRVHVSICLGYFILFYFILFYFLQSKKSKAEKPPRLPLCGGIAPICLGWGQGVPPSALRWHSPGGEATPLRLLFCFAKKAVRSSPLPRQKEQSFFFAKEKMGYAHEFIFQKKKTGFLIIGPPF
jgi:hypothetical protein